MNQLELLNLANMKYDDDIVSLAPFYNPQTGKRKKRSPGGDTLARFIVIELIETFDPKASSRAQAAEAARVMRNAADQLLAVADGFHNAEKWGLLRKQRKGKR